MRRVPEPSGLTPQQRAVADLAAARIRGAASGRGSVIILAAAPNTGRSHLLRALEARPPAGARVLTTRVSESSSSVESRTVVSEVLGGGVAAGVMSLGPVWALAENALRIGLSVNELQRQIRGRARVVNDVLPHLLRAAARKDPDRPLLCLIDDAHELPPTWWMEVQFGLAREIRDRLPVVLLLAVDAAALDADTATPVGQSAGSLEARGLADVIGIAPLGTSDVTTWLGPAPVTVVRRAIAVSRGEAGALHDLWTRWEERGFVRQSDDGSWTVLGSLEATDDDVADALVSKLAILARRHDVSEPDAVRRIVGCAALEGSTFTAEAVAMALGWSRDMLVDFLDDVLADEGDHGVVAEDRRVDIVRADGELRHFWTYRFRSALEHRIAAERLLDQREQQALAAAMASALEELYATARFRVGHRIVRLWRLAGVEASVRPWWMSSELAANPEARAAIVATLLAAPTEGWLDADYHLAARVLLDVCAGWDGHDPYLRRIEVAEAAERFARAAQRSRLAVTALIRQGETHAEAGQLERGRACLSRSRDEAMPGMPDLHAVATRNLAWLCLRAGERTQAYAHAEAALELERELGDSKAQSSTLYTLACIQYARGDSQAAEEALDEAHRICASLHDATGISASLTALAGIALADKRADVAEARIAAALALEEDVVSADARGNALRQGAVIASARGDLATALARYRGAAALYRATGEQQVEASATLKAADAAVALGDVAAAVRDLGRALDLAADIGSPDLRDAGEARLELTTRGLARQELAEALDALIASRRAYRNPYDEGFGESSVELERDDPLRSVE